ncbi:S-adenosyl-L-methionine-dependent methyltransferase [Papiliotrema laurentii]|uniref:S-adenosyl-L-methionine-dependent methyltransferase n=1 Tax=Papiliotrema laurentii TaxID=5418 RepID=A0AAD9CZ85_PAPLA|nr:S-adenosyl-L-methionine-dependent methyltransferase [Papiliotrema laurentii]
MSDDTPHPSSRSGPTAHGHGHHHPHAQGESHGHGNAGHSHAHTHGHAHNHDQWSGEEYLKRPGVQETAVISHDSVVHALTGAGLSLDQLKHLDLLEVGCGAGAVTAHLVRTFGTVHSIDTSLSMLQTFSTHLPSDPHNLTWALHGITPASPAAFASGEPMLSPSATSPEGEHRKVSPPRAQFDVAIANLVVHHVDDLPSFFTGLLGLVKTGGWIVITEFGLEEGAEDPRLSVPLKEGKKDEHGSVNSAGHFHPAFTVASITELFTKYGLVDVHAEIRGRLPVFEDKDKYPLNLIARGRKP